jgi:hypothetical protein
VTYTATPPPLESRPLAERILQVRRRLARLQATLRDCCPGEHRYVQHGDGKLPWCPECGFTDAGLHRSENGNGSGLRWSGTEDVDDLDDLDDEDE